ncbi:DUF4082 domain-containing protein [Nonomuraea sp. NPDC003707]
MGAATTPGESSSLLSGLDSSKAVAYPKGRPVEVGVRFSPTSAGTVTAIRFLKAPGSGLTHQVSLWDSSGRRLAITKTTTETASGWQQATLPEPVTLDSGKEYIASYHTSGYMATQNFFAKARHAGPLIAPATHNGVYRYGVSAFPAQTWKAANYWVDVVFFHSASPYPPSPSPSATPTTKPSPEPSATPSGGAKVKCLAVPSKCGYPDGTNTGYKPTGVNLTTEEVKLNQDGDFVITKSGVIDGKDIRGCVIVKAPNVTIKRSKITCTGYFNIRLYPKSGNFLLEDVEVDGSGEANNAAFVDDGNGPVIMRRVNMHDVSDGPHPGEHWLIEDSYLHSLTRCAKCHNDTIQSAGAADVVVRHNTLENMAGTYGPEGGMNAVVRIATEQGPVKGFVVENNLLAGGNFAVQVRSQGNGAPTGVKIVNNRIGKGTTPDKQPYPRWGTPFDFDGVPSVIQTGNVWDNDNKPVVD